MKTLRTYWITNPAGDPELINETTETPAPNFDQRITALVEKVDQELSNFTWPRAKHREWAPEYISGVCAKAIDALHVAAAVCRDYAREQARTDLTAEAQSLGMYDVTDGHEDDR